MGRYFAPIGSVVYSVKVAASACPYVIIWRAALVFPKLAHALAKLFLKLGPAASIKTRLKTRQNDRAGGMKKFTLVLYQPDIPQNTGTMLRTCACLGVDAAIIEPAGFPVTDRHFRRSGMDYLDQVTIERHASWDHFEEWRRAQGGRLVILSTKASEIYTDFVFQPGDILLMGRESAGVPDAVHEAADARIIIPMAAGLRSLNVAVAAAMVLGEALRQIRSPFSETSGKTADQHSISKGL